MFLVAAVLHSLIVQQRVYGPVVGLGLGTVHVLPELSSPLQHSTTQHDAAAEALQLQLDRQVYSKSQLCHSITSHAVNRAVANVHVQLVCNTVFYWSVCEAPFLQRHTQQHFNTIYTSRCLLV